MLYIPTIINNQSMSSGSHLSKDLHDLIKSIGQTRSKEQEDKIITNQLANLKPKLTEPNIPAKKMKELLIRALYIEMLGQSAQIAHIEALKLTQSKNLSLKRVGYLLCSLFFNQQSDLLIMLTATIQKDLTSTNINECVICLTSLPKIVNETIANAVGDSVIKLLSHQTDLIRKKALLVIGRIQKVCPGFISDYNDKLKSSLIDREPSVMACSLSLYYELIKANPEKYKDMTPTFVIILKQVIEHKLPKDFDYHKIPAPWIQIKILRILALLGKNDLKASEHCYAIVGQTLEKRFSNNNVNIGFALLYQCVQTIATIYPNNSLLQNAALCVSKFLESTSNNLKYMGITLLSVIFKNYPKILDQHQITVIDCLESKDETLRNETLELLSKMTNNNNINVVIMKMLESLNRSTDPYFRNNLVNKISDLSETYAPSHEWYIDKMHNLFESGSEFIKENVLNNYLRAVEENLKENSDFGELIVQTSLDLLGKVTPTDLIAKAVAWVCGEIGSRVYVNSKENLHEVVLMLLELLKVDDQAEETKIWILDALDKISSIKAFELHSQIKKVLQEQSLSSNLELAIRAIESRRLAKYNAALRLSNTIKFDKNLTFLQDFVESQKRQGAQDYNKNLVISNEASSIGLNFTPYVMDNTGKSISSNVKAEEESLIFTGPEKWNAEGYIPDKGKQPQEPTPVVVNKKLIGMGSNSGVAVQTHNYTIKKEVPKEDPNKKKLANELFGGVAKKPLIGPGAKKTETKPTTTKPAPKTNTVSPTNTKPTSTKPAGKVETIDLLDM